MTNWRGIKINVRVGHRWITCQPFHLYRSFFSHESSLLGGILGSTRKSILKLTKMIVRLENQTNRSGSSGWFRQLILRFHWKLSFILLGQEERSPKNSTNRKWNQYDILLCSLRYNSPINRAPVRLKGAWWIPRSMKCVDWDKKRRE